MGILKDIFKRFQKQCETAENHPDEELRTHYYKGNVNQVFQSVEQSFRQDSNCHITSVSKEHGEIAVEVRRPVPCFLIVTIISVKPLETAVDFNISSEKTSLTGMYPLLKKQIITYYERINRLHTYVGNGRNA